MIPGELIKLSGEIRQAEQELHGRYLSVLKGSSPRPSDSELLKEVETYAIIFLHSLRIHLCLNLIEKGYDDCREIFHIDWRTVLRSLMKLEETSQVTGALLTNAADIILLLEPENKNALLRQLGQKIRPQSPLTSCTILCGLNMAEYCIISGRRFEACTILQNLITLSEERNVARPEMHREIVRRSLEYFADIAPPLAKRICEQQTPWFQNTKGMKTATFHWCYAISLLQEREIGNACEQFWSCRQLCLDAEGDYNWLGAKAGILFYSLLLEEDPSGASEEFLQDALQKIDNDYYVKMGTEKDYFTTTILYALLHHRLLQQELGGHLSELCRLRDICVQLQNQFKAPHLTVRSAENLLGGYYLQQDDYLQAATHSMNALTALIPKGIEKNPPDDVILSNLLLIYTRLNDEEQIIKLMGILGEKIEAYPAEDPMTARIGLLLLSCLDKLGYPKDEWTQDFLDDLTAFSEIMDEIPDELDVDEQREEVIGSAIICLETANALLDTFPSDAKIPELCQRIALHYLSRPGRYSFTDTQYVVCYNVLSTAQWQLNQQEAILSIQRMLSYGKRLGNANEDQIAMLRCAAARYYSMNRADLGMPLIETAFSCITEAWQKAVSYLNDHRICQLLSSVQNDFNMCYSLFRQTATPEELYERLICFKDLPTLVGRERNRVLRLLPVDERLKERIISLQDQLAAARMHDALMGTDTVSELSEKLLYAEAEFAERFPENIAFTPISLELLYERLPNRAAILEYYFVPGEAALTGRPISEDAFVLDIFVVANCDGKYSLHHISTQGYEIMEDASELWQMMQEAASPSQNRRRETLRNLLFDALIAPALPFLGGIQSLYIAPDRELNNLPFEILRDSQGQLLSEKFQLARLVCGRDLLFSKGTETMADGCFLLGDPDYEAEKGERSTSLERTVSNQLAPVHPLPFSRLEVQRIGARCHAEPYLAQDATKYALQEALPCGIIHLATHGVFDVSMRSDSLYSSYLVFAGYNKWVIGHMESRYCGNGVLTADEMSRMDMHRTELVILSACQSGLGNTSRGSLQGMLSAFSAAGVHWVISHMWKASDFASAILMDAFYDAYLSRGMDVPDALQYAKDYLRNVTVGELRAKGWLNQRIDSRLDDNAAKEMERIRQCRIDRRRFFEDVSYWGGFVCHKCR